MNDMVPPTENTLELSGAQEHPFEVSELRGIYSHPTFPPTARTVVIPGWDCFYKLPWEIREMIAVLLL